MKGPSFANEYTGPREVDSLTKESHVSGTAPAGGDTALGRTGLVRQFRGKRRSVNDEE